jgi:hypothetical protein
MEFDPESIPDCNDQADVGRHFLLNETIPETKNESGYLRVTKTSLWWQQREFPGVWTTEGLSFCLEKGYICSINSSTWNHLQALWQGTPLDLLRSVFKEIQYQDRIEACGYRSPTWQILRALLSVNEAKVMVGESAVTAAPFFDCAGRPSQPFGGLQQGNKVVLWESFDEEERIKCWELLEQEKGWVIWCRTNPGKTDKTKQTFQKCGRCIFTGKCKQVTKDSTKWEEASGGKYVTRARGWWKRGDVATCAAHASMACWVHQDSKHPGRGKSHPGPARRLGAGEQQG